MNRYSHYVCVRVFLVGFCLRTATSLHRDYPGAFRIMTFQLNFESTNYSHASTVKVDSRLSSLVQPGVSLWGFVWWKRDACIGKNWGPSSFTGIYVSCSEYHQTIRIWVRACLRFSFQTWNVNLNQNGGWFASESTMSAKIWTRPWHDPNSSQICRTWTRQKLFTVWAAICTKIQFPRSSRPEITFLKPTHCTYGGDLCTRVRTQSIALLWVPPSMYYACPYRSIWTIHASIFLTVRLSIYPLLFLLYLSFYLSTIQIDRMCGPLRRTQQDRKSHLHSGVYVPSTLQFQRRPLLHVGFRCVIPLW